MSPSQRRPLWCAFVAGGLGDMTAACVSHPMDVVKVRMQLAGELSPARQPGGLREIARVLRAIVRAEGVAGGAYRGLSASLLRQLVFSGGRHGLYATAVAAIPARHAESPAAGVLAGAGAGALAAAVATPCDVVLIRMQADGHWPREQRRGYRHVFHGMARVVAEGGVARLWRGCGPTVVRAMLVTASQVPSYAAAKRALVRDAGWGAAETRTHLIAALVSALAASLATCPADVVKTRLMNMQPGGAAVYSSALQCAVRTVQTEGVLALYKGLAPTFARLGPHTIVLWLAQERILRGLDSWVGYG